MKKIYIFLLLVFSISVAAFAQGGHDKISYQSVVRDGNNHLVYNTQVTVAVSIANHGNPAVVYSETHTEMSNDNGLISFLIGDGNSPSGDWDAVQWNRADITLVTSVGGVELSTHTFPLSAVPYALHAKDADTASYADSVDLDVVQHYLDDNGYLPEVPQVLSISNDTIYLTRGGWVKLPVVDYNNLSNKPDLAPVATSGNYDDLVNKPQKTDLCDSVKDCVMGWISDSTRMVIDSLNAYYDTTRMKTAIHDTAEALRSIMSDAANDARITIKKNGAEVDHFTVNQSEDQSINILIPTKVTDLTDADNYVTNAKLKDTLGYYAKSDTLKKYLTINGLCDSVKKCEVITTMQTNITNVTNNLDSTKTNIRNEINSKVTNLQSADNALSNRITADSNKLVNNYYNKTDINDTLGYYAKSDTLKKYLTINGLCDSVKKCEVITAMQTNITDVTNNLDTTKQHIRGEINSKVSALQNADVALSNRITADSNKLVNNYYNKTDINDTLDDYAKKDTLKNYLTINGLCDSVKKCEVITTMQTNITNVTNNLDSTKTNIRNEINSKVTNLQSADNALSNRITADSNKLVNNYYTRTQVDSADNKIRSEIGDGTLTITYGTNAPVTFTANQKTNTNIEISAPPTPNNATLTIQKNGTAIGSFTADQASPETINITVPTCDSLNDCDLIKNILSKLEKLEHQNDSLAGELDKMKPSLTVAAPQSPVTVCSGSTKPVTYTATFHNCSNSDYTIAWKVNGVDSSAVTGVELTVNLVEDVPSYEVICVATRSDNTSVTDTVTTTVTVDNVVPSFTATTNTLTVSLSNIVNTNMLQWDTDSLPVVFDASSSTAEHTYSVADTITITATSEQGCSFSKGLRLQPIAPTVTTDSVPDATIAATTAKAYGAVTSDGGVPATKRGIVYSTSNENLELGAPGVDSVIANGTGKGNYSCDLKRLVPCTKYYVRAFAFNDKDTVYGDEMNFTTLPFTCGSTLTDIDGNEYRTLQLGSQCWMQQNLRTTHFADGTEIPVGGFYNHSGPRRYASSSWTNEEINAYGYLYNWDAAMNGSASSDANPSGVQGVCPDGWHLPSDAEWTQLTSYVASNSANVCDNDPDNIARALAFTQGWGFCPTGSCEMCKDPSTNNSTGFSVFPAGTWHVNGALGHTGQGYYDGHSIFRTATLLDEGHVQAREFYTENPYVDATAIDKTNGLSVRCVLTCPTESAYKPTVSAVTLSRTGTTVTMTANVISDGGADVTERGVCWGTTQQPTTTHVADGMGVGEFTVTTEDLTIGITYHVRAYATNSKGTAYGPEVIFNMPKYPTVTTSVVSNVTSNTAISGGNVTDDGGRDVTARGVCWNTSSNPTITNSHTSDSTGMGEFSSRLENLTSGATYYVRAYATNDVGTAYGEEVTFTMPNVPTVTTGAVNLSATTTNNVITVTATCECNVTDGGTDAVIARGVCWNTSQNPTLADSHTTDGSGTGSFTSNITDFNASTTYYVRAYATNSVGTAYGNQVIFAPKVDDKSCTAAPTVTDHEGNEYATVKIGNQCWMRENLRTTTSPKTGTYLVNKSGKCSWPIYNYTFKGSKVAHWHSDDDSTSSITKGYGLLYNWCAVMDTANPTSYKEVYTPSDGGNNDYFEFIHSEPHRGICPVGWHVPSNQDWNALTSVFSKAINHAYGNDWTSSDSTTAPGNYNNNTNRNISGFTAFPAGKFGSCNSDRVNSYAYFWGSTQNNNPSSAVCMLLYYNDNEPTIGDDFVDQGMSVRCVRDAVTVITSAATNILQNSATLNGSIANPDNVPIADQGQRQGFEWKVTTDDSYTQVLVGGTTLTHNLTELTPNTSYTFRAFATTTDYGTFYGEVQSFTTEATDFTVTTAPATNIKQTSATLNGSIANPSHANVTVIRQGFVWKTDGDDSYDTADVEGTTLSHNLTGLTQNTIYTFHTFATTTSGTEIGDEMSFTTPSFSVTPSASTPLKICDETTSVIVTYTAEVMNNQTDATSSYTYSWSSHSGNASANGATYTVTYTAPGPYTVSCTATPTGGGDALDPATATATISIKGCPCTVSSIQQGVEHDAGNGSTIDSVKDDDGNWYGVVQIGPLCWMAENLRTTRYYDEGTNSYVPVPDGSSETPAADIAYRYVPNNKNPMEYGYLYNWRAAIGNNTSAVGSDYANASTRGVCPAGWHVPSWMEAAYTIISVADAWNQPGSGKYAGGDAWESTLTYATPGNYNYDERNSTGFSAIPAGYYTSNGTYSGAYNVAYFWTCRHYYKEPNDVDLSKSYYLGIQNSSPYIEIYSDVMNKAAGMSVRCVRDE